MHPVNTNTTIQAGVPHESDYLLGGVPISKTKKVAGCLSPCIDPCLNIFKKLYNRLISHSSVIVVEMSPSTDPTEFEEACTNALNAILRGKNEGLRGALLKTIKCEDLQIKKGSGRVDFSGQDYICGAYDAWAHRIAQSTFADALKEQFLVEKSSLSKTRAAVYFLASNIQELTYEQALVCRNLHLIIEILASRLFDQETVQKQNISLNEMMAKPIEKAVREKSYQIFTEVLSQ